MTVPKGYVMVPLGGKDSAEFWKPENAGEKLSGVFIGFRDLPLGKCALIEVSPTQRFLVGHTMIVNLLDDEHAQPGLWVQFTYEGRVKSKDGLSYAHFGCMKAVPKEAEGLIQ